MTASSLSISLAQLGQRGAVSSAVTPMGVSSSSSSSVGLALGLADLILGAGGAFLVAGTLTAKTCWHSLQRAFFPTASAGTVIFFSHSGQMIVIASAIVELSLSSCTPPRNGRGFYKIVPPRRPMQAATRKS